MSKDDFFEGPDALGRRESLFPVVGECAFLSHAAVCPLPQCAADGIAEFVRRGSLGPHENEWTAQCVRETRALAARLLGCESAEIALLGPTALGLSLVAQGLDWQAGDEVVFYPGDYPSNVYPWMDLERLGVKPAPLRPSVPGVITWEVVEPALTPATRLVSLATCHFLSGYRIDMDTIGRRLHERGILFCVDAIQTLGAFPLSVEHVDFLSADSHKWLLGPCGAGIVYVRREVQPRLRPSLLGAWNVFSPDFVAQPSIRFYEGGRRYEPGALNLPGIAGMRASIELLLRAGVERVGARILVLSRYLTERLTELGFEVYSATPRLARNDINRSGIVTVRHPSASIRPLFEMLARDNIIVSYRRIADGTDFIRFSPHFYNSESELDRTIDLLGAALGGGPC